MKKSLIASAVALGLGTAGAAQALTVGVTTMNFNGAYGATGSVSSNGTGSFTSTGTFFGQPWTADAVSFYSGVGAHTFTAVGSDALNNSIAIGNATYNFSLTASQVAWGTYFDWNGNYDIPVLAIMTCTSFSTGGVCTGTGTPMQTPPFAGAAPAFDGIVSSSSATTPQIPIPAAAWLFGSGLVGMAGVARRNKKRS